MTAERDEVEQVKDSDALLRRVPSNPDMWSRGADGSIRPSSAAFAPHPDDLKLSVDMRRLIADPADPCAVLDQDHRAGLSELFARLPRSLGLDVVHAPLRGNRAHANVDGFEALSRGPRKRVQKELAKGATWIRMPTGAATST